MAYQKPGFSIDKAIISIGSYPWKLPHNTNPSRFISAETKHHEIPNKITASSKYDQS
jgi:hypothetical protein